MAHWITPSRESCQRKELLSWSLERALVLSCGSCMSPCWLPLIRLWSCQVGADLRPLYQAGCTFPNMLIDSSVVGPRILWTHWPSEVSKERMSWKKLWIMTQKHKKCDSMAVFCIRGKNHNEHRLPSSTYPESSPKHTFCCFCHICQDCCSLPPHL